MCVLYVVGTETEKCQPLCVIRWMCAKHLAAWNSGRVGWRETWTELARQAAIALFYGLGQLALPGIDVNMRRLLATALADSYGDEAWGRVRV